MKGEEFEETIDRHAFDAALASGQTIRALLSHDPLSIHQKLDNAGHQKRHNFRTMYVPFRRFRTTNFSDAEFVGWLGDP